MTKEELEKDYYADRPTEPYSDDDSPNDWANIAHYAEENLKELNLVLKERGLYHNGLYKRTEQFLNSEVVK